MAADAGLMSQPGLDLVTVRPDPVTYRMAYDVVSNSTLWFCHHHLFDLARRPRAGQLWAEAWDAYRAVQRPVRRGRGRGGRRRGHRPRAGLPPVPGPRDAAPGPARPEDRPLQPHPVRRPQHVPGPAHRRRPGAARGHGRRHAPAVSTRPAGRRASGAAAPTWGSSRAAPSCRRSAPTPAHLEDRAASAAACDGRGRRLDELVGDRRLVVRVDRLEPSKNLLRGFWAFDELLRDPPAVAGGGGDAGPLLRLAGDAWPSTWPTAPRSSTPPPGSTRRGGPTTGAPSSSTWPTTPTAPFAALTRYDVLLVNPLRDGLNLVAKEGPLVNDTHGVLVLSREAGAFEELRRSRPRDQPLRRGRHGRRRSPRPCPWPTPSGPGGRADCGPWWKRGRPATGSPTCLAAAGS